ncbi:outer membrane efflux protein [Cystobacter fuscus DSM 2262]|uniref:Outer membrane efflux protein n=1 Tax=Cystobacter fuscus (strain ATCC 25194 / DSM 2262 / NBRC 100088 / M29) TaxID=1242864 RepID=S9P383_CYSF2|nr:TolC family protein [Cystobacter fuscus]EPX56712.1 outer membrane efflux protein [Cystobacter fuscus DSM 2262]
MLVLASAASAEARESEPGPVLTESEAVAHALRRAPLRDTVEGDVTAEQGRGRAAGAYPNPQLAFTREQTFGASGSREDYLSLAQTLDLGARRALQGEAGEARARAARREGDAAGLSVAAEARLRFHEVLYRQARVRTLEGWGERIEQALTFVTRREQRGDAATYDRRRVERERAVATGRLETEQAALERARARLQALLGADVPAPGVTGTLLPDTDPAELPALRASSGSRPELLALDLRIEAATLEHRAASRWWAPDLLLEGGWKGVDLGGQGRTDGFLLGASLSLPLWDRSSGLAHLAAGEARAARGRRALLESELDGELAGARAEAVRLRRAAAEFHERTTEVSSELVRIASAGYAGGELGLLELLDAYRGATDDFLTALDMAHAARRARIELDRLTGVGLP